MIFNKIEEIKKLIYRRMFLRINSALIMVLGFVFVIFLGAVILSLPISSRSGRATNFLDALFAATGSVCVTGRALYDTGTHWSSFGHFIIITLIQIGGLGFMSMWILFAMVIKKRVSPKTKMLMAHSINLDSSDGIFDLAKFIFAGTLLFEAIGAVLLSIRFIPMFGVVDGIKMSIFHSISAFCNAGIDLMGKYSGEFSSMVLFYDDALVNMVLTFLIIVGGIGFFVWKDIFDFVKGMIVKKERKFLSLYTKLVLIITAILLISGTVLFLALEWNNSDTIGSLDFRDKLMVSYFHSVSCRSAGFNTINVNECRDLTKFLMIFLMFIGASSGSTGGGIKTVTFGIILIAMFQTSIGRNEIVVFRRKINTNNVLRALSLSAYVVVLCMMITVLVSLIDNIRLMDALFETVAALTTVGYTFSAVMSMTPISKIIIITAMFIGRVGVLTFTFGILLRVSGKHTLISYPEENIFIG